MADNTHKVEIKVELALLNQKNHLHGASQPMTVEEAIQKCGAMTVFHTAAEGEAENPGPLQARGRQSRR